MRIIVDMQALQTGSRFRGIGRYALDLIRTAAQIADGSEIILALSSHFSETIEEVRASFTDVIPQKNIRVWHAPGPVGFVHEGNAGLRAANEIIREYFLLAQQPDVILLPSLFEGLGDSATLSIGRSQAQIPVASICHDLIPLVDPTEPFQHDPVTRRWYRARLDTLRKSSLILTNSEYSRQEVIRELAVAPERVETIMAGSSPTFRKQDLSETERTTFLKGFGIDKPFVMFAGSLEASKNVPALLAAFGKLTPALQSQYQIVVAGKREPDDAAKLLAMAPNARIRDALRIVGHVSDVALAKLYTCAHAFVFPSKREGFGLPPLEAMACGTPTIAANRTSLPEVVPSEDALFSPDSPDEIAAKLTRVLTDTAFRERIVHAGLERASELSWEACARRMLTSLRKLAGPSDASASASTTKVFSVKGIREEPKSVLVSKLDHAGDFLLALPAMAKIRARYPNGRVDALVGSWNKIAAEHCGLFDNVYTLDYFRAKSSLTASVESADIDRLKSSLGYYDFAIDLRRHSDTRFILLALNAGQYFGYRTGNPKYDNNLTNPLDIHPELAGKRDFFDEMHISEQMLRLVETLPYSNSDYVSLPAFSSVRSQGGTVGIFPRVGSDARQWDSDRFVELVRRLCADRAIEEVNLFGVSQQELDDIGFEQHPKLHYHVGLPFSELTEALGRNQVCVGNNSFGVHLGSLLGCQTVAIYSGHEMPEQWGPAFGNVDVVTANVACSPCHLPTKESCPYGMRCLTSIEVTTVFNAIMAKMTANSEITSTNRWTAADCFEQAIRALNRLKFSGELDPLDGRTKERLQASLLADFPNRRNDRDGRLYLDISAFLPDQAEIALPPTALDRACLEVIAQVLQKSLPEHDVTFIASGMHDHEYYATSLDAIGQFFHGQRTLRIVYPAAGDVFLGVEGDRPRNAAQWDLLQSWRQLGVRTCFIVPRNLLPATQKHDPVSGEATQVALQARHSVNYLSNFDVLILPDEQQAAAMRNVIAKFGQMRARPIEILGNTALHDVNATLMANALEGSSFDPDGADLPASVKALTTLLTSEIVEARFELKVIH